VKVGILSDPHGRGDLQREAISKLKEEGAQYLLHAGDFISKENIESLAGSNLPYAAVLGNNDGHLREFASQYRIKSEPYYLKLRDVTVKLMHIPYYLTPDTDVVIYGHTHIFDSGMKGGTLYINPGEICAREKDRCECVLLGAEKDRWIVDYFYKKPLPRAEWFSLRKIYPIH
jgi:putative phosphoesterase